MLVKGFIENEYDAMLVLQAARQGLLPIMRERKFRDMQDISSGTMLVVEETEKMKRWRDGRKWSPSRVCGKFLVYREIPEINSNSQRMNGLQQYGLMQQPMVKKSIAIDADGQTYRILCYYRPSDVEFLVPPHRSPFFESIVLPANMAMRKRINRRKQEKLERKMLSTLQKQGNDRILASGPLQGQDSRSSTFSAESGSFAESRSEWLDSNLLHAYVTQSAIESTAIDKPVVFDQQEGLFASQQKKLQQSTAFDESPMHSFHVPPFPYSSELEKHQEAASPWDNLAGMLMDASSSIPMFQLPEIDHSIFDNLRNTLLLPSYSLDHQQNPETSSTPRPLSSSPCNLDSFPLQAPIKLDSSFDPSSYDSNSTLCSSSTHQHSASPSNNMSSFQVHENDILSLLNPKTAISETTHEFSQFLDLGPHHLLKPVEVHHLPPLF